MLKYGAASELHAPPRVLEPPNHFHPSLPLSCRAALIADGFWQVHFARLNAERNGKKLGNVAGTRGPRLAFPSENLRLVFARVLFYVDY